MVTSVFYHYFLQPAVRTFVKNDMVKKCWADLSIQHWFRCLLVDDVKNALVKKCWAHLSSQHLCCCLLVGNIKHALVKKCCPHLVLTDTVSASPSVMHDHVQLRICMC